MKTRFGQKRSFLIAVATIVALVGIPSVRADMSHKDKKFMEKAAAGGTMEVTVGKLASEQASMDDVKKFGQMMVDDHSKANKELGDFARSKGVDLKDGMEKGTKDAQKMSVKLEKKKGSDFDKEYIHEMVEDHEDDVKAFEDASKDCDDADLKAWADKMLPTLKQHLQMAKDLQAKMK
jgi:putative membrane protein